jgi:hypothetical protein
LGYRHPPAAGLPFCLGKKEAKTVSYAKTRCSLVTFSAALFGGIFVSAEFFTLRQLAADGIFLGGIPSLE